MNGRQRNVSSLARSLAQVWTRKKGWMRSHPTTCFPIQQKQRQQSTAFKKETTSLTKPLWTTLTFAKELLQKNSILIITQKLIFLVSDQKIFQRFDNAIIRNHAHIGLKNCSLEAELDEAAQVCQDTFLPTHLMKLCENKSEQTNPGNGARLHRHGWCLHQGATKPTTSQIKSE